jgi:hypothetical protein
MPAFKDIFGEKDEFPAESNVLKKEEVEYDIKVEKETIGQNTLIKRYVLNMHKELMFFLKCFCWIISL